MRSFTAPALLVTHAWRRTFTGSSAAALDPMLGVYLADLVRPYGLALREDMLRDGSGQSYGEMAAALLREVLSPAQPIDLLVFAFAMHDVVPGRATACYLSHVCPGEPMALALCDAGAGAAFTGLRLVSQYARAGDCRRALLVVAEQSALHYDSPANDSPATVTGTARADGTAWLRGPKLADGTAWLHGAARADGTARLHGPARADGPAGPDGAARADGAPGVVGLAPAPVPALNSVVVLLCESLEAARENTGATRGDADAARGNAGTAQEDTGAARGVSGAARESARAARESAGAARLAAVRQHAGVTRDGLDELLSRELPALAAQRPGATLILGGIPVTAGQLPPVIPPGAARVIVAPPELPYTGLWWELAGGLAERSTQRRHVLLAGYDQALGYLSIAAFDPGPRR